MLPLLVLAATVAAGPVVSADWVQQHQNDPHVCVIHVGDTSDYKHGHIPGARLVDHMDLIRRGDRLAPAEELARAFAQAGVTDGARVVLYARSPTEAGYVYSALAAIGFADDVSWLDGGLGAWREGNRPVETATPPEGNGTLTIHPPTDLVVDAAWMRDHLNSPKIKVLDVRSQGEWQRGHLPGATLILWEDLFSDAHHQTFKSPEEIRALLARAGLGSSQEAVVYCTMGMRAGLMFLATHVAGVKAHVYPGGWEDWSRDPANPMAH
jgi:thiosulfate/3-mercaptopyruvate sulfurtransferase